MEVGREGGKGDEKQGKRRRCQRPEEETRPRASGEEEPRGRVESFQLGRNPRPDRTCNNFGQRLHGFTQPVNVNPTERNLFLAPNEINF